MSDIGSVFLDLGGVLYDLDYDHLWGELARISGATLEEVKRVLYRRDLFEGFESGRLSGAEYYRGVRDGLKASFTYRQFTDTWNSLLIKREPVFRIVRELAAQIPVLFISNTNEINADYIRDDLEDLGKHRIYSHEVGCLKPDPAIYLHALSLAGMPAERSLFVDDREENIRAAACLNMHTHLFRSPGKFVGTLVSHGLRVDGTRGSQSV